MQYQYTSYLQTNVFRRDKLAVFGSCEKKLLLGSVGTMKSEWEEHPSVLYFSFFGDQSREAGFLLGLVSMPMLGADNFSMTELPPF